MSERPDTIYLTTKGGKGRSKHEHWDAECSQLASAEKAMEKPVSVVPDGFYPKCDYCTGTEESSDG